MAYSYDLLVDTNSKLIPKPCKNIAAHFKRAEKIFKRYKVTCFREYLVKHFLGRGIVVVIGIVKIAVAYGCA